MRPAAARRAAATSGSSRCGVCAAASFRRAAAVAPHCMLAGPAMTNDPAPRHSTPAAQLAALMAWLPTAGVEVDAGRAAVVDDAGGVRVVAAADLAPGTLLGVIPKAACLSPTTSLAAPVLARERLGGGLGLTVAVLAERAAGGASSWCGYLDSLPARESVFRVFGGLVGWLVD